MEKDKYHLIWDTDGTLIDSYDAITKALKELLNSYDIFMSEEDILNNIISDSVSTFLREQSKILNIDFIELKGKYSSIFSINKSKISLMPNLKQVLEFLNKQNVQHYIFTHKGNSIFEVLDKNNIKHYFIEVISNNNGFARKPDPEAIDFLVNKYHMNRTHTYYIGDRELDVLVANNSNILSIFYNSNNIAIPKCDYSINNLLELNEIFSD